MNHDNRVLYDLAAADPDVRFSPFCWRTKLALAHKGIDYEPVAWRFTDKEKIAFSGQGKVPVLVDGELTVADSWAIAIHLEFNYPDRPSLFGGAESMAVTRFVNEWADRVLNPAVAPLIMKDIHDCLHADDQAYFRASREKAFGTTLEALAVDRDSKVKNVRRALDPLRALLKHQPFVSGQTPAYADYIPFGTLQWARCASAFELLEPDDPVSVWRELMLDSLDGLARRAKRFAPPNQAANG